MVLGRYFVKLTCLKHCVGNIMKLLRLDIQFCLNVALPFFIASQMILAGK